MPDGVLNQKILDEMAAEFKRACQRIDTLANDAANGSVRDAFQALLAGNTAERDRLCDLAKRAEDARAKSKIEAWYKIGEKHGISREEAARWLQKISH